MRRASGLFLLLLLLAGCAGRSTGGLQAQTVVVPAEAGAPQVQFRAPVFVLHGAEQPHNRLGQVRASRAHGATTIFIDPETPVLYAGSRSFATARGTYTNLIYRVHFTKQPFRLLPFHLGAGNHVGLLVILTLDNAQQVLLVTTAQTCGCYAVSIPTQTLSAAAYPDSWPATDLPLYGERLPARLPPIGEQDILRIVVRPDVQRVMDLEVMPRASLEGVTVRAGIAELETLKHLPLEDGSTTSFYHPRWPLTGHVKGAIKPWETLLLSLVSLDLFVGMDKEYGDTAVSGNPFYTSLKPWNRRASDMNDFPAYLRFNGWKL